MAIYQDTETSNTVNLNEIQAISLNKNLCKIEITLRGNCVYFGNIGISMIQSGLINA